MTAPATIRFATPADVAGIAAVLAANGEALEEPGIKGYPYLEFLLERGRVTVADLEDGIVGFASAIRVGSALLRLRSSSHRSVRPRFPSRSVSRN